MHLKKYVLQLIVSIFRFFAALLHTIENINSIQTGFSSWSTTPLHADDFDDQSRECNPIMISLTLMAQKMLQHSADQRYL